MVSSAIISHLNNESFFNMQNRTSFFRKTTTRSISDSNWSIHSENKIPEEHFQITQGKPPNPRLLETHKLNHSPSPTSDALTRTFNTALISSRAKEKKDFAAELKSLTESTGFKAILSAVKQLSQVHGLTEKEAAEKIIETFKQMDQLWCEYVSQEGLEKIRTRR